MYYIKYNFLIWEFLLQYGDLISRYLSLQYTDESFFFAVVDFFRQGSHDIPTEVSVFIMSQGYGCVVDYTVV
jgi:hypothetical protein